MDKWEYRTENINDYLGAYLKISESKLNGMGRNGWELVVINSRELIFKRKIKRLWGESMILALYSIAIVQSFIILIIFSNAQMEKERLRKLEREVEYLIKG